MQIENFIKNSSAVLEKKLFVFDSNFKLDSVKNWVDKFS